jgi:hypothetical protein
LAACGGQTWSANQTNVSDSTVPPGTRTHPTALVDSATFCNRLRNLVVGAPQTPSPTAATVIAEAAAVEALVHDAPLSVRGSVGIVADAFASYASALRHAGSDPGAQTRAIFATAVSVDGRRLATAYAKLREYAKNTCRVQVGSQRYVAAGELKAFVVDQAIHRDRRFWPLPVSINIATNMGATTVNISAGTLDPARSLEICHDVETVVYARAPTAVIEVGTSPQHVLVRSTQPGACAS